MKTGNTRLLLHTEHIFHSVYSQNHLIQAWLGWNQIGPAGLAYLQKGDALLTDTFPALKQ